jgi:hypothetical protein
MQWRSVSAMRRRKHKVGDSVSVYRRCQGLNRQANLITLID